MGEILSPTSRRAIDPVRYLKQYSISPACDFNSYLGCLLTCYALFGASRSIRAGDHNRTNRMFRARIYAQGFTLVAMLAGSAYWSADRDKRKEFEGAVAEQKAKEKSDAWIRELEARDEEEKEIKAAREARRQGINPQKAVKTPMEQKSDTISTGVEGEQDTSSAEGGKQKGVLQSVQDLVWGKKN
jgi:hypothetical protein